MEDAKQEGKEQEPPDENKHQIPDEENAIEMTNDIDGALHDMEAGDKEGESGNEEENEPELDKQMGDVDGNEDETLDERMWGDSDNEEEQEVSFCGTIRSVRFLLMTSFSFTIHNHNLCAKRSFIERS